MHSILAESALLTPGAMRGVEALYEHVASHELASSAFEYEPLQSPRPIEPLLLKQVFEPELFNDHLFLDLFRCLAADPERAIGGLFRVYIDGMLSPRDESEVLHTPALAGEGFEAYVTRATKGRKFGIVVNGVEQWSDPLARFAARVFGPLIEAQGVVRSTVEVTLFIGNYGYTPFGIHIDDPYTTVVHLHCGPATKEMTLFGIEQFHRLNGARKNCFQPKALIPHGRTFAIEPGDLFLLPPHNYHVGSTPGFSIGVAFALSKYPPPAMSRQILQYAIGRPHLCGPLEQTMRHARARGDTLADWLGRAAREHTAQGRSRQQLRYNFLPTDLTDITPRQRWTRDPDFPIVVLEEDDDILLFARGHRIRLARSQLTRRLVVALPVSPFTLEEWHGAMGGTVSLDAISALLRELVRSGGLQRL